MKFEAEKCSDIKCKYIHEEMICPEDSFDEDMCASCSHPEAPKKNGLGCDDNSDYLKIPEWCPRRSKERSSSVTADKLKELITNRSMDLEHIISKTELPEIHDSLKKCIKECFQKGYTESEISFRLHQYISNVLYEVYVDNMLD